MKCLRCESLIIDRKPTAKYCSDKCARLYLKSQWRRRTREARNAYAREYRRAKNGGNRSHSNPAELREASCLKCGIDDDLQLAHIKPLWAGGKHKYVITLCRKHHSQFDNALRRFWQTDLI